MTYWNSTDNYGQQMQLYALQKYLKKKGHSPYLIRYNYSADVYREPSSMGEKIKKIFNLAKVKEYIHYQVGQFMNKRETNEYPRHFEYFRQKYISMSDKEYTSLRQLQEEPPVADMYIVGSDQVWNFYSEAVDIMRKKLHAYFLDFGSSGVRRRSYAASWGRTYISEHEKKEIKPLLDRFESISVREKSGIEMCHVCGRNDAIWQCDPTLLLNASEYRKLYTDENIKKENSVYALFYYVENGGKYKKKEVYRWAKKKNLNVIYVSGNNTHDQYTKTYASIPEWLCLIDNAEYVITNSFHCCIFSIIFQKKFACIRINGKREEMNTRLSSLFELCHILPRYIEDNDFSVLEKPIELMRINKENFGTNLEL